MVSILIGTVPIHGHVMPLLPVAKHFAERGDRVRFLTGSRFADVVRATGAEHLPLPLEADFDDRQDWDHVFPQRAALRGPKALAFDVEHIFIRPGGHHHDAITAADAAEQVDVVLTDPAFAGGAFLVGQRPEERPPVVVCGVVPLMIASRDTAPYGMGITPMRGPVGRARNAVLQAIASRTVFSPAQQVADGISRERLGTALRFPALEWPRHAEAIVQFTVREFEYPRSDAPPTLRFAGPISATGSRAPLPPWWGDLDGTRPVVHVTQGTIANRDYRQVIGPTLAALAGEDVLVVVATGGRPVDTLPPLPANARAAEYLPYDDLLPKTDVYVTNGGYGGVQYALKFGVPIVTTSGHEDKPEVAGRVAWSGVGRRVNTEVPTPAAIGAAVHAVLADRAYRDAARRIAARMAESGGVTDLARIVDRVVGASPRRTPRSA